jgi:predicted nucleotide-binding protein
VDPIKSERKFLFGKIFIEPSEIREVTITQTDRPSGESTKMKFLRAVDAIASDGPEPPGYYLTKSGTDVTKKFLSLDDDTSKPSSLVARTVNSKNNSKQVFIVHGHDEAHKHELARLLQQFGLEPILLDEKPGGGRTLIEKFEEYAANSGHAFVLLTPDDIGGKESSDMMSRARQNVIFELGYLMGKLGRHKVTCLYSGNLELPTDISGIEYFKFHERVEECYLKIKKELENSGYNIN